MTSTLRNCPVNLQRSPSPHYWRLVVTDSPVHSFRWLFPLNITTCLWFIKCTFPHCKYCSNSHYYWNTIYKSYDLSICNEHFTNALIITVFGFLIIWFWTVWLIYNILLIVSGYENLSLYSKMINTPHASFFVNAWVFSSLMIK